MNANVVQTNNAGVFESRSGSKKNFLTVNSDTKEFRLWNAKSSKLASALQKGLRNTFLKKNFVVLYLGASTGTTVSHISDIVGNDGLVFAVEISPTTCRDLVFLVEERNNIAPILADANLPLLYEKRITKVDWLYQDVAQHNQVEIFLKNAGLFLKNNCFGFLALKTRSVDVIKDPKLLADESRVLLEKEFKIVEQISLAPFQKDHWLFVCQKKN